MQIYFDGFWRFSIGHAIELVKQVVNVCRAGRFFLRVVAVLVCASLVVFIATINSARAEDLHQQIKKARSEFQPVGLQDIRLAFDTVRSFMPVIDRTLRGDESWRKYLLWERQNDQLAGSETPDVAFWRNVYRRVSIHAEPLEREVFQGYRRAVQNLIDTIEAAQNSHLQEDFHRTLDGIAMILPKQNASVISSQDAEKISRLLSTLRHQKQAADLIEAVRQRYSYANFQLYIPRHIALRDFDGPFQQKIEMKTVVDGFDVRVKGQMSGRYQTALQPSDSRARIRIDARGASQSNTTASGDGITLQTREKMNFRSTTGLNFGIDGIGVEPVTTSGKLETEILDISTTFRRRRDSIVRDEVEARQEDDRKNAQQAVIRNLNTTFQKELVEKVKPFNDSYRQNFYTPLICYDRLPQDYAFRSDEKSLQIQLHFTDSAQLAAPAPLANFASGELCKLAVHQSAINNTASALAGRSESLSIAFGYLFRDNNAAKNDAAGDVRITYDQTAPMKVVFDNGEFHVVILGSSFQRQSQRFSGMEISLRFRLETVGGKKCLVAVGEPQVMHPADAEGKRPKVGIRDLTIRRILLNFLKRDVPTSIDLESMTSQLQMKFLDAIDVRNVSLKDGWFRLEFDQQNSAMSSR